MTFPLVKNIYEIDGKEVITIAQTLFYKVYVQTHVHTDKVVGSEILVYNWWKFMLKAKYIRKAPQLSKAY